ncbi:MAG: dockerin type I domain-containing protein [bacterium]|nr:dockerin type I domain-containing protein [bacterium]
MRERVILSAFFGFLALGVLGVFFLFRSHVALGVADSCEGADVSGDGVVNIIDLVTVSRKFGQQVSGARGDVNGDGKVNIIDLVMVARYFGEECALSQKGAVVSGTDCNQTDFSMAFILFARNGSEVTHERIEKLEATKATFAEDFSFATRGLARMDTSYPVVVMVDDGTLVTEDTNKIQISELIQQFYREHPDNFDFVSIYVTFDSYYSAFNAGLHVGLKMNVDGITNDYYGRADVSLLYGSKGRLQGYNFFVSDINGLSWPEDEYFRSGGLLHETGHQWCCYVGGSFAGGQGGAKLEIIQQGIHFYRGLASPDESGDPMGSDYWVSNGDGTYRRDNRPGRLRYHPFQLYFMGLLPESEYSRGYAVYDAGIVGKDFDDTKAKFYKTVSVNDIISVVGKRECVQQVPIVKRQSSGGTGFSSVLKSIFWVIGE